MTENSIVKNCSQNSAPNIAIVGIDASFGAQTDIDRVERALYLGKEQGIDQTKALQSVESLISLSVERMASAAKLNVADIQVIVVSAQAIAVDGVQVLTELSDALILSQTILAQTLIAKKYVVAIIGVNSGISTGANASEVENAQELATISFDQSFSCYKVANGFASLLLTSADFAKQNNQPTYGVITAVAHSMGEVTSKNIQQSTEQALVNAQVTAKQIGFLEVSALGDAQAVQNESSALINAYQGESLSVAISSARSITGEGAGFSQVFGLLRSIIALQQRYIPAISDWQAPQQDQLSLWQSSSFYLPTEARPWYPNSDGSKHYAAYSCLTEQCYSHIILSEYRLEQTDVRFPVNDIRKNGFIACSDLHLVLVSGDDESDLQQALDELDSVTRSNDATPSLNDIAKAQYQQYLSAKGANKFTISLISESIEDLQKEIQSAKAGIANAFDKKSAWKTPKGSAFTANPVSTDAVDQNISFMYPGIGATYVGLGRDLFHLFPEIYQGVAALADDIGSSLKDTLLNPRTIIRPSFKELKQLDLNLRGNLADIAEAGVGFACVFTKVFEDVFKVKADFATGYSMGEVSMYAALSCWQQPGLMSARLAQSDTFNHRLCGELLTLREHWGLPELSKGELTKGEIPDELIWETYTIKATLAEVEAASIDESRVYCTIVNTPDSLLLAGYPDDCLRVIKKLGVRAMPLNMANAIHSPPANKEYSDMVELYTMAVNERINTKMYSSSCYLPVPQRSKAIANSIAKCLCDQVDFPRLVNTLHDKGARVFIEMGPGRSLCSWVDKILDHQTSIGGESKARVSVPVNAKGTSDELTYIRAVAKLISHGVTLDLATIFNGSIVMNK